MGAKLSIITITRNDPTGFANTADMITNQRGVDFKNDIEWIVINGGSITDRTAHMMSQLKDYIHYGVSERDKGLYHAMNKGMAQATGDYIWMMNGGDTPAYDNTAVTILNAIEDNPGTDYIYGQTIYTHGNEDGSDRLGQLSSFSDYRFNMPTTHQSMLYRRDKIGDLKYNESLKLASDQRFTARYLHRVNNPTYIQKPLCRFAGGGASATQVVRSNLEHFAVRLVNGAPLMRSVKDVSITLARHTLRSMTSEPVYDAMKKVYHAIKGTHPAPQNPSGIQKPRVS